MFKKHVAFSAVIAGAILIACNGHGVGGGDVIPGTGPFTLPAVESDLVMTATLPARTIGEELPSAGLGTYNSPYWHATIGGFTQTRYSQTLGFPPGTKITLRNLSKTTEHTLDVVQEIKGPPVKFPKSPTLRINSQGHGILGTGYASGIIKPGKAVTITLSNAGTYLIGCAFHYKFGMRDVFVVAKNARPGQEATPPPKATATPSGAPSPSMHPSPSYGADGQR
jgi:plastocyanin